MEFLLAPWSWLFQIEILDWNLNLTKYLNAHLLMLLDTLSAMFKHLRIPGTSYTLSYTCGPDDAFHTPAHVQNSSSLLSSWHSCLEPSSCSLSATSVMFQTAFCVPRWPTCWAFWRDGCVEKPFENLNSIRKQLPLQPPCWHSQTTSLLCLASFLSKAS